MKRITFKAITALMVAMLAFGLAACNSSSSSDSNLTAQSTPSNGAILSGSNSGGSGVRVTAAQGTNAFVKVKSSFGGTVVAFFVRSGSTAEVKVPAGTYSVQFAMGDTWYGTSDRFGSKTSYGQDKSVSLSNGDVITYSLQRSSGGNFSMGALNGSEF